MSRLSILTIVSGDAGVVAEATLDGVAGWAGEDTA
jgi:hypothetical protein